MAILVPRQPAGVTVEYAPENLRTPGTRDVGVADTSPRMIREAMPIPGISSGVSVPKETTRFGQTAPTKINPLAGAALGALAAQMMSQRSQRLSPPVQPPRPGTGGPSPGSGGGTGGGTRPGGTSGGTGGGTRPGGTTPGGTRPAVQEGASRIPNPAQPGQMGYGWQYFSDGTAISPNGEYYKDGQPVWSPHPSGEFYWADRTPVDTEYLTEGQEGYGWQYFQDGTAISPEGDYYYQGDLVYSPGGTDSSLNEPYYDLDDSGEGIIEYTDPGYYYDNIGVDVYPVPDWAGDISNIYDNYQSQYDYSDIYDYGGGGYDFTADYGGYEGWGGGGDYDSWYGKKGGMPTPMMKNGGVLKMADGGDTSYEVDNMYTLGEEVYDPVTYSTTTDVGADYVNEITNPALPGQAGYGWRYFSDGTAIDPQGNYYSEGEKIYDPNVGFSGMGARFRDIASNVGSTARGALDAVTNFAKEYPGPSGALVGALLSQAIGQSTGGGRENLGVDMSKFGAITPRTTTFGVGAPRFMTYADYGSRQAMPEMYGTELYRNLNAPGFNPVNPTPVAPVAPAMRKGGLACMADGGPTYYTYGKPVNPADNLLAQGGQPMMGGGSPMVEGRMDYRHGSAVNGPGDGQSDDIPAMLADGEYVIDAETVAMLGNGSNKAGAEKLDEFRKNIREHKRNTPLDKIPPPSKSPLAYLKGKKNG